MIFLNNTRKSEQKKQKMIIYDVVDLELEEYIDFVKKYPQFKQLIDHIRILE